MEEDPKTKLATYRNQLAQVEAAIEQDPENPEWTKLRTDLLEVIQLTSELDKVKSAAQPKDDDELRTYAINEKCQAIFEQDGQWYNAKIVALSEDGYFVTFLGYGNTAQVEFSEVRPYQRPDTSGWRAGTEVTAIYAADGRWYDATIRSVGQSSATVVFKGISETADVELDFVRLKTSTTNESKRKKEEVAAASSSEPTGGSKLPKSLEVRPDDSAEEVAKKKKKLNMFKRQERRAQEETQGEGRRSSWAQFSGKNKTIKKAKNHHDPNWDPTRDHGELAARQQMEKYTTYMEK